MMYAVKAIRQVPGGRWEDWKVDGLPVAFENFEDGERYIAGLRQDPANRGIGFRLDVEMVLDPAVIDKIKKRDFEV